MLTAIDRMILKVDKLLRVNSQPTTICRTNPANAITETHTLSLQEKNSSIAMMRINHSGEVCAQALYAGQALTARSKQLATALNKAALEEIEHLTWCENRLGELNARTSLFNPLWYAGSFAIGAAAGLAGDKISLGFLAETEYQVTAHLEQHLATMSIYDLKSRAILEQMRIDELQHATAATTAGAKDLPQLIKTLMHYMSRVLVVVASRI